MVLIRMHELEDQSMRVYGCLRWKDQYQAEAVAGSRVWCL